MFEKQEIIKTYYGKKLKEVITNSKFKTQEAFALEFGCDLRTLNRYLNEGIKDISVIWDMCELLEIDFNDFIKLTIIKEDIK